MTQNQHSENQAASPKPESAVKHLISFLIMIILTAAAFYVVMKSGSVVAEHLILPLILVFAVIQVFLQLFTFMHLGQRGSIYYTIFIMLGIVIAVISAVGIILM
ncbi:MAG: cytochrome C oxidase subunit IV family protein [Thermoactinomyces sp.]